MKISPKNPQKISLRMEDPKNSPRVVSLGSDTLNPKKHKLWLVAGPFKWEEIRFTKLNQHNKTNLLRKAGFPTFWKL
jgi:hypothetical protein